MRFKIFLITLAVAVGVTAFSLPASANVSTDADESVSVNDSVESYSPLTPSGKFTVIDDVWEQTDEDSIENKQFITVESKNGNIFYTIITLVIITENINAT